MTLMKILRKTTEPTEDILRKKNEINGAMDASEEC